MVDAFAWTTQSPTGHTHRRLENIWGTAVPQTETPTMAVVRAVTIARVVTIVLTTAKAVTETVVVVSPAAMTRIVTVILTAVIVVTAIAIGAGVHLLVVTHPTIVGAGAIPGPPREPVALLGRQGIMMAPPKAPAGKYASCHYLST